jgi:hypothetical protein
MEICGGTSKSRASDRLCLCLLRHVPVALGLTARSFEAPSKTSAMRVHTSSPICSGALLFASPASIWVVVAAVVGSRPGLAATGSSNMSASVKYSGSMGHSSGSCAA